MNRCCLCADDSTHCCHWCGNSFFTQELKTWNAVCSMVKSGVLNIIWFSVNSFRLLFCTHFCLVTSFVLTIIFLSVNSCRLSLFCTHSCLEPRCLHLVHVVCKNQQHAVLLLLFLCHNDCSLRLVSHVYVDWMLHQSVPVLPESDSWCCLCVPPQCTHTVCRLFAQTCFTHVHRLDVASMCPVLPESDSLCCLCTLSFSVYTHCVQTVCSDLFHMCT